MKDFTDINARLQSLTSGLGGELWRRLMIEADPPRHMPQEDEILDVAFRDAKAVSGYVPDLMAIMRRHVPGELDAANHQALRGILGLIQLVIRMLMMILLTPRYKDHQDLINTFNAYRQIFTFVEDYLAKADGR